MYFKSTSIAGWTIAFKQESSFKVYAVIPRLLQKTPTCPAVFRLFLHLRNLDVTFQGHWGFFQIFFSFSQKICFFFYDDYDDDDDDDDDYDDDDDDDDDDDGNIIFISFVIDQVSMTLFVLLGHPQYPIFVKCSTKYHM